MPFETVSDLKNSSLYDRMETLQQLGDQALQRFISAFNSVFERVQRNGGSADEAESMAIPIALSAARRAGRNEALRRAAAQSDLLDDDPTFFIAHVPEHFGAGTEDGSVNVDILDHTLVTQAPEVAEAMVKGQTFDHGHRGEAVGLITGLHLTENLDAAIPDTFSDEDKNQILEQVEASDAAFVYEGKYFQDTSEDIRSLEGVSPEWATVTMPSGEDLLMPDKFVVTGQPLNSPLSGIRRIKTTEEASAAYQQFAEALKGEPSEPEGNNNEREGEVKGPMPQQEGPWDASLAELIDGFDEEQASLLEGFLNDDGFDAARLEQAHAGLELLEEIKESDRLAGLDTDTDTPKDKLAALLDKAKEAEELASENSDLEDRVATLETRVMEKEAERFCEEKLAGKVPTDKWEDWKDLYQEDPQRAETLAEDLPENVLGEEDKEAENLPEGKEDKLQATVDQVLGIDEEAD